MNSTSFSVRLVLSFAVAAVFTIFCVNYSSYLGSYALPVVSDDIGYYYDGMHRLFKWHAGNNLISQHITNPPHSPVYTYLALSGFTLIGWYDWAPLVMTGLFIWILCWVILTLFKNISLIYTLLSLMALLTMPFLTFFVTQYRPDMATGLTIAFGAFFCIRKPWIHFPWKNWCVAGMLFGLALLLKPAYCLVTFALLCSSMGCALLAGGARDIIKKPGQALKLCCMTAGIAIFIATPHFIVARHHIFNYIYVNLFGDQRHIWMIDFSLYEQLTYYLWGSGGKWMVGKFAYYLLITCIVAFLLAIWRKDKQWLKTALFFFLFTISTYVVVSATSYMSGYLGAPLFAGMAICFVGSLHYIFKYSNMLIKNIVALLLFVVIAYAISTLSVQHKTEVYASKALRHQVDHLIADIAPFAQDNKLMQLSYTRYLTEVLVCYELMKQYGIQREVAPLWLLKDIADVQNRLNSEPVVAITLENITDLNFDAKPWFNDLNAWLHNNKNYTFMGRYPIGNQGMAALVYYSNNLSGFFGIGQISGMREIEGPYPKLGLPRIRWSISDYINLFIPPSAQDRKLILEMRPIKPETEVTITLANKSYNIILASADHFQRAELIVPPADEDTIIKLFIPGHDNNIPVNVMFKSIQLWPVTIEN